MQDTLTIWKQYGHRPGEKCSGLSIYTLGIDRGLSSIVCAFRETSLRCRRVWGKAAASFCKRSLLVPQRACQLCMPHLKL